MLQLLHNKYFAIYDGKKRGSDKEEEKQGLE